MSRWSRGSIPAAVALGVAVVGAIDAATDRRWDLVASFVLITAILGAWLVATTATRPTVTLRRDLHRWLSEEAAVTGEPVERLLDRAVAARRSGLTGDPVERSGPDP